ncbi:RluA family pseudouridine synthase [Bacillus sp. OxB-1]|uniref:RluA family pseudouridine synthase n=1 Tax=Bacillus sp. (strain OxB-1) TaxID=98228 RepID=UPI000597AE2D|nr:RluA family pseudouridine synthase [Bacillus sp. OxB-1]
MQRKRSKPGVSGKDAQQYTVEEKMELLSFLLGCMKKSSRNSVKSVLARGQVTVDGKVVTQYNHLLEPGQQVAIISNQAAKSESDLKGVSILYEDDDLLVVNKEAGILTMADRNEREMTAYRQVTDYVLRKNPRNRIFIVHRLDKDTSGVLLFAKSEKVKHILQNAWNERVKERTYIALVEGVVGKNEGTISSWLKESKTFKMFSSPTDNGGQHAVTHYRKIRSNGRFTLLEVQLETGRKNQIRVHMEELGHPIVGDRKYGATGNPLKRLGLHAFAIAIIHPRTGELMRFEAKVPSGITAKSR